MKGVASQNLMEKEKAKFFMKNEKAKLTKRKENMGRGKKSTGWNQNTTME